MRYQAICYGNVAKESDNIEELNLFITAELDEMIKMHRMSLAVRAKIAESWYIFDTVTSAKVSLPRL